MQLIKLSPPDTDAKPVLVNPAQITHIFELPNGSSRIMFAGGGYFECSLTLNQLNEKFEGYGRTIDPLLTVAT